MHATKDSSRELRHEYRGCSNSKADSAGASVLRASLDARFGRHHAHSAADTVSASRSRFLVHTGLGSHGPRGGAVGGLLFVGMQHWWNPRDSRVVRIRNSVVAWIIVGVGSLWVNFAISS